MQRQIFVEKFLSALKADDVDAAAAFGRCRISSMFGPNPSHPCRLPALMSGSEDSGRLEEAFSPDMETV